jgi:hypothetical protein
MQTRRIGQLGFGEFLRDQLAASCGQFRLGGQQVDVPVFRPGPEIFLRKLRNPDFLGLAVVGNVTCRNPRLGAGYSLGRMTVKNLTFSGPLRCA